MIESGIDLTGIVVHNQLPVLDQTECRWCHEKPLPTRIYTACHIPRAEDTTGKVINEATQETRYIHENVRADVLLLLDIR